MTNAFEEKKEIARIMRNVFIVITVFYVGLIIWSLCRQNYVPALFDVAILLMNIITPLIERITTPKPFGEEGKQNVE